jgi:DNA mismatch endonuclease (patch repair protein)
LAIYILAQEEIMNRRGLIGRISPARSRNMAAIRSKNTKPELLLRKSLFKLGLRYRIHPKNVIGKPDVVFVSKKVAIFCDGNFWHGHNWRKRKALGQFRVRKKYWVAKIEGNIARDKKNNYLLRKQGWTVLRFWEDDIKKTPELVLAKITATLSASA